MGFRNPITTATAIDTRVTVGVPGFYTSGAGADATRTTSGAAALSDGFAGDDPAGLFRTATANPRQQAASQSGGLALRSGSYAGLPGPELDLNVELVNAGVWSRVARLRNMDKLRTSPDGATWHYRTSGRLSGTTDGNGMLTWAHGGDGDAAPTAWGMQLTGQATDPINLVLRVLAWGQDATTVTLRASRTDTSAWFPGTPVTVAWWAEF